MEGRDHKPSPGAAQAAVPDAGHARRLSVRLRPTRTAAEQARRTLRLLSLPRALAEEAQLLVSELVTNSVRHAGLGPDDPIHLVADWSGTRLRVHVHDRPGRTGGVSGTIRPPAGAESGWGLYLVDRLASRWGTSSDGYWFELRPSPRRPAT